MSVMAIVASILAFPVLMALPSGARAGGAGPDEEILKSYSYEKLRAASTYLFALIEQEGGKVERLLPCDPPIEKAKGWHSGTLRYLIDEKEKSEVESYKKNPKAYGERVKGCAARFACEAYYSVLSSAGESMPASEAHRKLLEEAQAGAKLQTTEKTKAWAKKQTWFCGSSLRRYLQSQQP